jgi:putative sigma-54 modulation protein
MDLHLTGKNLEISAQARDYITLKLNKLNRYLPNILAFDAVASREMTRSPDQQYIVQVTIDSNGTLIRGEERAQDIHAAADKVYEVLSRQIEHHKGKLPYKKGRRPASIRTSTTEATAAVSEEAQEEGPRVVKNKRFELRPMSMEEAVDQMQLLGHDFFLYYDPDNNHINLLYKRRDGNLGLIETVTK